MTHPEVNKQAEDIPKDLQELLKRVAELPEEHRSKLELSLHKVTESIKRRRRILSLVQEAILQLRLDMKYLVFDLEATRRERDALRQERDEGNME